MVNLFLIYLYTIHSYTSVIHTLASLRREAWRRIHQQVQQHSLVDGHGTSSGWHSLVFQQCDPIVQHYLSLCFSLSCYTALSCVCLSLSTICFRVNSCSNALFSSFLCLLSIYINNYICKLGLPHTK